MAMRSWRSLITLGAVAVAASLCASASARAAGFTSSAITVPASGSELFYNGDTGSGSVTVQGTVSPAGTATTGDLLCYGPAQVTPWVLDHGIAVSSSGAFEADASLSVVHGQACTLRLVPAGTTPSASAAAAFTGPEISVSDQYTYATNGNVYGYDLLAGILQWSFEFGALGECAIRSSYSTDPSTLESYSLFDGNACLLQASGIAPDEGTRSGLQIDGLNAYPPAAISSLTGQAGFAPLDYDATWDATHDTVTITETDAPIVCSPPGGYPPSAANCPSLSPSGIEVHQTTTLMPGSQVARVTQQFTDVDGKVHDLDLLFSQSIAAPVDGATPGYEFPGQSVFASHAAPDSYSLFPPGPGSIFVIASSADAPGTANPIGAITYGQPPLSADFVNSTGSRIGTLLMHYSATLPAGGSLTYTWSFSQAADTASLTPLAQVELDRYHTPTLRLARPRSGSTQSSSRIVVSGTATDTVGISSVTVDRRAATVTAGGHFATTVDLHRGRNTIRVVATNVAGNEKTVTATVVYKPPPCIVPGLTGRPLAHARAALSAHGCALGRVRRVHSKSVRKGHVISTTPGRGTHHRHGTKVRVLVSAGPKPVRGGH
jgi:Glucodextranase, domain B/PASTA domain